MFSKCKLYAKIKSVWRWKSLGFRNCHQTQRPASNREQQLKLNHFGVEVRHKSNWNYIEIMLSSSYFRIYVELLRNWQQFDLQQRNCSCWDLRRKLQQIDAPQRKHQSGISQFQPLSWAKCYWYFPFPWTNAAVRCWLLLWKEFKSFRWKHFPRWWIHGNITIIIWFLPHLNGIARTLKQFSSHLHAPPPLN